MYYIEYADALKKLRGAMERYRELIEEREELFQATQPGAIRYDTVKVLSSVSGSPLETYVERVGVIDQRIAEAETNVGLWKIAVSQIEEELNASPELEDRIYYLRVVKGYPVSRIARTLHYSPDWIRKKLRKIRKSIV